jgi:hypothetical protein
MGGQYPYDVWIDYEQGADIGAIAAGVRRVGVDVVDVRDATASLAIEQGLIMACGLVGGGAIGTLCALLIVPALQVGAGSHPGTPPVAPRLAWVEMGLAASVLVAAVTIGLLGLAIALRRTELFSVVKLGDTN